MIPSRLNRSSCSREAVGFYIGSRKSVKRSNAGLLNRVERLNELKRVVRLNAGSLERLLNTKFKLVTRF